MDDLTRVQRDMLFAIARQDEKSHYRNIKRTLNDYYEKAIYNGHSREYETRRVFPHLDALVENGLVEKIEHDERLDFYRLTAAGRRTIAERLAWQRECLENEPDLEWPGEDGETDVEQKGSTSLPAEGSRDSGRPNRSDC